jgi:hypothetical protein
MCETCEEEEMLRKQLLGDGQSSQNEGAEKKQGSGTVLKGKDSAKTEDSRAPLKGKDGEEDEDSEDCGKPLKRKADRRRGKGARTGAGVKKNQSKKTTKR